MLCFCVAIIIFSISLFKLSLKSHLYFLCFHELLQWKKVGRQFSTILLVSCLSGDWFPVGVSFDILKDPDYYYWTFELCNGSICLTNTEGYLSKKLKGLRIFWIMYKTSSSALSLTSDREWKPQCQDCTARLRKKEGQMEYFKTVRRNIRFCEDWEILQTMGWKGPILTYICWQNPQWQRGKIMPLVCNCYQDFGQTARWILLKRKQITEAQWSLGTHFRRISSSLLIQPGLKLDRQPNHPCWGQDAWLA